MVTPELLEYVKSQRATGANDDTLRSSLLSHGWSAEDVTDALKPASASTPTSPLDSAPAPLITQPTPGMSTTMIATLSIVGILLLGSAAGAAYWYYRPSTPPVVEQSLTPEQVLEKTKVAMATIKSFTYVIDLSADVTGPASTTGSTGLAPDPNASTPGKQTLRLALSVAGSSDMLDPNAASAAGAVNLSGSMTGGTRPLSNVTVNSEFRVVGGSTYVKINNVSVAELEGVNYATAYWIKIDPKTAGQFSSAAPIDLTLLLSQANLTTAQIEQVRTLLTNAKFLQFDTTLSEERIDEVDNYHYHWSINKEQLKQFIVEVAKIADVKTTDAKGLEEGMAAIEKTLQALTLPGGEIWIRKNDFMPSKVLVDYALDTTALSSTSVPQTENIQANLHTTMTIANVNQPTAVTAPLTIKTLEEAVSAFMMGPPSQSAPSSPPEGESTPTPQTNETTDSDLDGLEDIEEARLGTDPKNPDTDGDKYTDGEEVKKGFSPLINGK